MEKNDLRRLIKIEDRIKEILIDEMGIQCIPVEFDIVPTQKMLEIMAYRSPVNLSNWKFGRDYEKLRTIHENIDPGLPYEVVINSNPARAYLMNSNTFAVQALVLAHVYGHVGFFTENKWFQESRRDIIEFMAEANRRVNKYERRFGIDEIETIVDAGHALQLHSNPFDNETEDEKRMRVFEQQKLLKKPKTSEFADLTEYDGDMDKKPGVDIALENQRLWRQIKLRTPVVPTEDLLRYIIDNSRILEDWHKDILEILRIEGQYYWPIIKTRYMNEGFATFIHQKIMNQLFKEGLLTQNEHGQYNYSNALVKAEHKQTLNPYLLGSKMWEDIEERWNKGKHGYDYDNCHDTKAKEEWDTKEMKGMERVMEVLRSYTDWFFMQDFLTPDLIDELNLYVFAPLESMTHIDYVRTGHKAREVRDLIVQSFAHSGIPKIIVRNGNHNNTGILLMEHKHTGPNLEPKYAEETLKHIYNLWNRPVYLKTIYNNKKYCFVADGQKVQTSYGLFLLR